MTDTSTSAMEVQCPTCRKPVVWSSESPFRPFCSQRCKMIDLGAWADESYRIAATRPVQIDEFDDQLSDFSEHH